QVLVVPRPTGPAHSSCGRLEMRNRLRAGGLIVALATAIVAVGTPASAGTGAAVRHTPLTTGKGMSFTTTLTRTAAAPAGAPATTAEIITCGGTVSDPYLTGG